MIIGLDDIGLIHFPSSRFGAHSVVKEKLEDSTFEVGGQFINEPAHFPIWNLPERGQVVEGHGMVC